MKKRTSKVSRRIVSLLMSMVLTLTLVTPAAFAESDMPDNGQQQEQQVPTDAGNGGSGDVNTPADDRDTGDKGTEDANKPGEDNKGEAPDGENKDEENKDEQPTEDENNSEDDIAPLNDDTDSDVWDGKPAEKFAGGAGTVDDPYKISTGAELAYLAEKVNGGKSYSGNYFKLTSDIRLNADDVPTAGDSLNSWTSIGNANAKKFQGTFDGDGHTISGLYINNAVQNQGLFGYVGRGGVVQNLVVAGRVTATGQNYVGGIVARLNGGTVQNCGFYGAVTAGTSYTGGVVGSGSATNCWYYRTDDGASVLGVYGARSGTNCYHNVHDNSKGAYYEDKAFGDGTVADLLNPYAYENGLPLWKVGSSYLIIDTTLKYDALVKLATGVKNSTVAGKVGFGSSLVQSKLTNSWWQQREPAMSVIRSKIRRGMALRSRKRIWCRPRRHTL